MKTKKYLTTILSLILVTTLLFAGCGKKEETVTAITNEQFTALYENAKTIYSETPELFAVNAEKPNIDLENVSDAKIPVSESMILKEAIQTIINKNFSEELSNVTDDMLQNPDKGMDESFYKAYIVAKQFNLITSTDTNYDEAITKAEAIDLILKAYEAIAQRDGYHTNHQDGLNEGEALNRGDQSTVGDTEFNGAVDINGNPIGIPEDGVESSIGGEDTETEEEINEQIEEAKKEEEQSSTNTSNDPETNYGKGYDHDGVHYETKTEYIEARKAQMQANKAASGALSEDDPNYKDFE